MICIHCRMVEAHTGDALASYAVAASSFLPPFAKASKIKHFQLVFFPFYSPFAKASKIKHFQLVFFPFYSPFVVFFVFQFFILCLPPRPPFLFVFYCPFSFLLLHLFVFVSAFRLLWVSSLAYPNLLGINRLWLFVSW
jgi:hypothetical protein